MASNAQAAVTQPMDRTCLLVFSKSKMSFVDRVDLAHRSFPTPLVIHFASLSSFSIVDQSQSVLRFFHREQETGQIQLQVSNIALVTPRTTTSIVLMNDGSLLLSSNTKDVTQLVLGDQANETSNWWF